MSSRSAFQRHLPLTRWIPLGRPFPTSWPWISSSVLRSLDTVISKPQACFPPTACRDFTDSSLLDLSLPPLFPLPLPHPDKSCFNCYHSFLSLYSFILFFECAFCTLFYWIIIALQCCVSFCCTTTWISYTYTYIPSLLSLPPTPNPTLLVITEHQAELSVLYSIFPLAVWFTHGAVCMSMPLSQFIQPLPFPPWYPYACSLHLLLYFCLVNKVI